MNGLNLSSLGIEYVHISNQEALDEDDEYISFNDSVYFTKELLNEFITRSRQKKECTFCALKSGTTTKRTVTNVQNIKKTSDYIAYNLYYFPEKKFRGKSSPIVINPDKLEFVLPMLKHMCGSDQYHIPVTDILIIQIDHWVNLWMANILSLLGIGARLQKKSVIGKTALALKAMSFNRWKILSKLNKIGRNCDIHHTAYIEGSTIGDNVTVGAGAIIRESSIGKDSWIGNGVIIEGSAIGEKSTILNGHILYSVLYPRTFSVTHMISASLIGKETLIGSGVILTDFRLDGKNVMVEKNGSIVDTENTFVGVCIGHRAYLGSGCIVAPGRIIPEGMRITPEKDRIIVKPGQDLPDFRLIKYE